MSKALRVTFPGLEPLLMPLDAAQATQFEGLLAVVAKDPSVAALLWPQLETAVRTELEKIPGNAEKLAAMPAGSLRPELAVVEVD